MFQGEDLRLMPPKKEPTLAQIAERFVRITNKPKNQPDMKNPKKQPDTKNDKEAQREPAEEASGD